MQKQLFESTRTLCERDSFAKALFREAGIRWGQRLTGNISTNSIYPAKAGKRCLHTLPLPYFRMPVSPRGELLYMSGDLVFVTATRKTLLGHLALEARGACVLSPVRLWQLERMFLTNCKTPLGFPREKTISSSRSFGPRVRLLVCHSYRSLWRFCQGTKASGHSPCTLPLPCYILPVSPRKKLISLSGATIFATATRDTAILPPSSSGHLGLCSQIPQDYTQWRKFLKWYHPQGTARGKIPNTRSSYERGW